MFSSAELMHKVVTGEALSPAERLYVDTRQTLLLAARSGPTGSPRWSRVPWYEAWLVLQDSTYGAGNWDAWRAQVRRIAEACQVR